MSLLRPRVCDDRGRRVPLPSDQAELETERALLPCHRWRWLRIPIMVLVGAPLMWLAVKAAAAGWVWPGVALLVLAGVAITAIDGWWPQPRASLRAQGTPRCASCLYDLSGIAPEPDGCTVCPECGAAWKLKPAGSEA